MQKLSGLTPIRQNHTNRFDFDSSLTFVVTFIEFWKRRAVSNWCGKETSLLGADDHGRQVGSAGGTSDGLTTTNVGRARERGAHGVKVGRGRAGVPALTKRPAACPPPPGPSSTLPVYRQPSMSIFHAAGLPPATVNGERGVERGSQAGGDQPGEAGGVPHLPPPSTCNASRPCRRVKGRHPPPLQTPSPTPEAHPRRRPARRWQPPPTLLQAIG